MKIYMTDLTITILAGGEGKRMNSDIPKILHLFKDRPMLVRVIETARQLNPNKIIVVTGKYNDLIQTTLLEYTRINDIQFVIQNAPLGTGDAIKCCLPYYTEDGLVLILNGDTPLITAPILKRLTDTEYDASLLVATFDNPTGYGRVFCRSNGDVLKIVEEKDCNEEEKKVNIVNTGIYCIHTAFLKEFIPKIYNDNVQKEFYLTDIVKLMTNRFLIMRSELLDPSENIYVSGVNTQEELAALEAMALAT
jgi:UDP-N-acetylglucosamine diphosphorylase/glucosamine-1-phosphate N-acetyltransferase